MKELPENWDGYDALPITQEVIDKASSYLEHFDNKPELSPEPDGEIALEWNWEDGSILSISINLFDSFAYSYTGSNNRDLNGEVSSDIESIVRLYEDLKPV